MALIALTVNSPSQDDSSRRLAKRLAEIPNERLVEEVIASWDDNVRLEGEIAILRRRLREFEISNATESRNIALTSELEEKLRIAISKNSQLEKKLQNEKIRREVGQLDSEKIVEIQERNAKLLRNEEELLLLIHDMEEELRRLTSID
ncbi:MAG: hypothetical protein CL993_04840 [Euryarchaeota archaeon]|nr:hypothetical protein [Euryarchaeota archaeon]|tara:strand:+ start:2446 stop:2889 length:444 start_codon:yes stop_codon:yes gene_type:complete